MTSPPLPLSPEAVAAAMSWAEQAGVGSPPEVVDRMVLAVGEAVSNVVEHAPGGPGGLVLSRRRRGRAVEVRVKHPGAGPPASDYASARLPPDWREEGGRGLFLIRTLADRVDQRPGVLTLTFRPRGA